MSTPTIFDLIVDGFKAVLDEGVPVSADITVDDPEDAPIAEASQNAVRIFLNRSVPEPVAIQGNPVKWQTFITVECLAKESGASARPAANALAKVVYARLAAKPDLGLEPQTDVFIGEPQIDWANDRAKQRFASARLIYRVDHSTYNQTLD